MASRSIILWLLVMLLLASAAGLASCNSVAPTRRVSYGNGVKVSGIATYRQRIALPDDAIATVRLVDITKPDAPQVIVQEIIAKPGQPPIPFVLIAPPNQIDQNHNYAVDATISVSGRARWHTTQQYGVITRGNPLHGITVWLEQVE